MRNLFPRLLRAILAAPLAVFDLTPFVFLLPVPETDGWTITGLVVICVAAGYCARLAFQSTTRVQRALLPVLASAAVLNVLTTFAINHLPATLLDMESADYIASRFGLDGEFAYNAAHFELWCELWLGLALVVCAIVWTVRKAILTKT